SILLLPLRTGHARPRRDHANERAQDFKRASSVLKRALVFNSKNADVFFNLGVMYAEVQKWDRALVQYELATRLDPKHTTAHNNLGVIHRRQGNMEAAIHCFETALKVDPGMNLASKNLGAVYGAVGRMADSIRLTKVALEANPQDAEALNNLALLHRDQGDVDICIEHLDKCLSLEPNNIHACSNRLMTFNYPSEKSREEVFQAHRDWGCQLERRVPAAYSSWEVSRPTGRDPGLLSSAPPVMGAPAAESRPAALPGRGRAGPRAAGGRGVQAVLKSL
ncbi:unnamed protein product, partial [Prorocentrum cordatum]